MRHIHQLYFIPLLLAFLAGCAPKPAIMTYVIGSDYPHLCCRSIRYSVTDFTASAACALTGDGLQVRLGTDTVRGVCSSPATLHVVIANNTGRDAYIPFSYELNQDRLNLYPWRLLFINDKPARLARQIQFGDILDTPNARLLFRRLPPGRQVELTGVIPPDWVCAQPSAIYEGYLEQELDPVAYAGQARAVRRASAGRTEPLKTPIQLRYDVVYTTLDFYKALPQKSVTVNNTGDTTRIELNTDREPASFLNTSQHVAQSNVVIMTISEH